MDKTRIESPVAAAFAVSPQLELGNGITAPDCVVVKVQRGSKGDLVGRLRSGKIVIFDREDLVEGYALAQLTEEREKLAFARLASVRRAKGGWLHALQPRPFINGPANTAEDFLEKVRKSITDSVAAEDDREAERAAAQAARDKTAELDREWGQTLAGDEGQELVTLMQKHDWHYAYSDCSATWRKGEAAWKEIKALIAGMNQGAAVTLWNKHAPEGFAFPQ